MQASSERLMKATVTTGDGSSVALKLVPVPKPGPGQVLVKIIAAAQNPSDGKDESNFVIPTQTSFQTT
jgi:hypothetical protein